MTDWDAARYARFERERTRPARDLLSAIEIVAPGLVVDLGCGPGNSTALLAARWPDAEIIGVDTSPDMMATARARLPGCRFVAADIAAFVPPRPVDVIFSNAALHWLPDHERLFPALFACLAPDGVLAVQMPDNLDEPTHVAMRRAAAAGPWGEKLGQAAASRATLLTAEGYVEVLGGGQVDVWRTTYHHRMAGLDGIIEWFLGSGLKPYVDPLDERERAGFLAAYREALAPAHPPLGDGSVLMRLPRLFVVAARR